MKLSYTTTFSTCTSLRKEITMAIFQTFNSCMSTDAQLYKKRYLIQIALKLPDDEPDEKSYKFSCNK